MNTDFMVGLRALEEGWIKVDLLGRERADELDDKERTKLKEEYGSKHDTFEVFKWCKANCQGEFVMFGGKYYFKQDSDATMFSLRWS